MTQPAYIYARFSSIEQAKGHSLERQLEGARSFITRNGWLYSPEREMVDEGRSAFHGINRAEGSALFDFEQKAREGHFANGAVLIVESLDRLTRQGHEETFDLLRLLTRNGVTVATFQDSQIYQAGARLDLASIITIIVKGELSREEIEKRQKRILAVWEKKIETIQNGDRKAITSMAPAWIDVDPNSKLMSLNPYRTKVLNQIYEWYAEGRGIAWIEKELNKTKEPTWTMKNNLVANGWSSSSLHKILTWRAVLGEYEPKARLHGQAVGTSKGFVIPDYYPQAVSHDLFNRAQAVRESRKRTGGRTENTHNNLFVSIVECGHCGGRMYHQINHRTGVEKKYRTRKNDVAFYKTTSNLSYLKCSNWRRGHKCSNSTAIRYETIETAILDFFFDDAIEYVLKPSEREEAAKNDIAETERQISLKQGQLANIIDTLAETPVKALAERAATLEADIEGLSVALEEHQRSLAVIQGEGGMRDNVEAIRAIRNDLDSEDHEAKYVARVKTHTALKNVIERIVMFDDGNSAAHFKDGEVFVFDKDGYRNGGTDSYYAD